jgi:hypothetical protein
MTTSAGQRASSATLVLVTLAEYQTEFWVPVAETLRRSGVDVFVLAFDDRSAETLEARSIPCARIPSSGEADTMAWDAVQAGFRDYGVDNVNLALSHERVTFRLRDTLMLARRFLNYARAVENCLDHLIRRGRNPIMVQELGGFISVLACYYAARRKSLENWFIEPSFFRGRLFFLRNSIAAYQVPGQIAASISLEVTRYLDETLNRRAIVIPKKDRHQYVPVLGKIANWRNVRRLAEKLYDKHVLGKRQEFGHIGVHARAHLEMAWNAARLRRIYTPLESAGPFIYYPLHVPADMALTLRSPEYFDQLGLIDYLLRVMPATHRLAIKEHPAQIGAIAAERIKALTQRYDNLIVLPPTENNYTVLDKAAAVISVNSKSGCEALLVGRPVIVLGDAFYTHCGLVKHVPSLRELGPALASILKAPVPDRAAVYGYFQTVHDQSVPGELYISDADNIAAFVASMMANVLPGPAKAVADAPAMTRAAAT